MRSFFLTIWKNIISLSYTSIVAIEMTNAFLVSILLSLTCFFPRIFQLSLVFWQFTMMCLRMNTFSLIVLDTWGSLDLIWKNYLNYFFTNLLPLIFSVLYLWTLFSRILELLGFSLDLLSFHLIDYFCIFPFNHLRHRFSIRVGIAPYQPFDNICWYFCLSPQRKETWTGI